MKFEDDLEFRTARRQEHGKTAKKQTGGNLSGRRSTAFAGKKVFDMPLFVMSVISGIVAGILSLMVYHSLVEKLWRPLTIGLVMLTFFAVTALLVIVFCTVRGVYTTVTGGSNMLIPVLLFGVGIFGAAVLFETIYEIGGRLDIKEPSSYLFLLDDSGSMETNDPDFKRYAAISEILKDKDSDFPYAVYSFSDDIVCLRELSLKGDIAEEYAMPDGQGNQTNIKKTLEEILTAFENGEIPDQEAPKVLLLSDGYASDIGWVRTIRGLLKRYVNAGISISTVGLGSSVDENLMTKIARETGGVYINVEDAQQLEEAMKNAITSSSKRDLLTLRNVARWDVLYCVERIVFMALLGVAVGIAMMIAAGVSSRDADITVISAIGKAILAGILLEVLINVFYAPESVTDMIYFVITALIFSVNRVKERPGSGSGGNKKQKNNSQHTSQIAKDLQGNSRKRVQEEAKGFDRR